MSFEKINIAEQTFNPFDLISKQWMLISAGTEDKWNTMTGVRPLSCILSMSRPDLLPSRLRASRWPSLRKVSVKYSDASTNSLV